MAIINCPSCHAKISSLAKTCSNCGFVMHETDSEEVQVQQRKWLRQRKRNIEKQQMLAIVIFVFGCAGFFYTSSDPSLDENSLSALIRTISPYLLSAGFLWYAVNRIRIFFRKI